MRGILSGAGYLPYRRLERSEIASVFGGGGAKGSRSVASHDEDTTTMGVEAARLALRSRLAGAPDPDTLWFSTPSPAYLDKTNATALHAALRLGSDTAAYDFGGALRSSMGALLAALKGTGTTLVVSADRRDGLATSPDEANGGDAGAALLVGEDVQGSVIAEFLGGASVTDEFVDRWRAPGDQRSKVWEERFGENRYVDLGTEAFRAALKAAGKEADAIDAVIVTGMHQRATKALAAKLGVPKEAVVDDLSGAVGQAGGAHPFLVLADVFEKIASEGEAPKVVALVHLADGADVALFATTPSIATWRPSRPVNEQLALGAPLPYGKFLSWRGMVDLEPPKRPEPQRVSATAAWRSEDWKFGFVGSRDRSSGAVHLPPSWVSRTGGAFDEMDPIPMAESEGTIVTFTIDRMAYSPSPPVVFAVVDFDGGGRFPVELTDVDVDALKIGDRVEMTFRRLFSADGIHDYFWKARPIRTAGET